MENRKDRKGRIIKEEQRALSRRKGRQQGRNEKQTTICSLPHQVAYTVHLLNIFSNFLKYHHSATSHSTTLNETSGYARAWEYSD